MKARTVPCRIRWTYGAVLLAGALIASGQGVVSAATCHSWYPMPPNKGVYGNSLYGVAATSSCNAWAAGRYYDGATDRPLIDHWNGHSWDSQSTPKLGTGEFLNGVAAISNSSAWAVGAFFDGSVDRTLIFHWNGKAWKRQASPSPGSGELDAVTATSASNAWAVGWYGTSTAYRTLILHWNGSSWKRQSSLNPGGTHSTYLYGVAALSASNAWAVGSYGTGSAYDTLILHWNGTAWKKQASPNPHGTSGFLLDELYGVTATSGSNAWAVGDWINSLQDETLILHWNGISWKRQRSPSPGPNVNYLKGVDAASGSNAWAVGDYKQSSGSPYRTLILRWNGKSWKRQPSTSVGTSDNFLNGIAATSPTNVWSVGFYKDDVGSYRSLAVHCC